MSWDTGTQYTGHSSGRDVREVWKDIIYLEPSETPFTSIIREFTRMSTPNYKYEHYEQASLEQYSTFATGYTTETTVAVADGSPFADYPCDAVNVATNEVMTITGVSTNTLTVTRGVGNSGVGVSITSGDRLVVIGPAKAEGATLTNRINLQPSNVYNYTQTFRDDLSLSRREMKQNLYGGTEYQRLKKETAMRHNMKLEKAFIWNKRQIDTSSSNNTTRFNGFIASIGSSSNVYNVAGAITKALFDTWLGYVFMYGSTNKILFLNNVLSGYIHQMSEAYVLRDQNETVFGWHLQRYRSPYGDVPLVPSRTLTKSYTTTGVGLLVDLDNVKYRYFQDDDTKYYENIPMSDSTQSDFLTGTYQTDAGLQLFTPLAHGRIYGATSVT